MTTRLLIHELLALGESQTLEFKSSFDKETIETLVAFANAQGGTVLVGVTDGGAVRGVTLGKETLNDWLGQIRAATSPVLIPDIDAYRLERKVIVAIRVGEYPIKPINTRGRYFKRVASSNHQLSLSEINDLYMQSLQLSWDAYVAPRHSLDDLDVTKIETFIDKVNAGGRFFLDPSPLLSLQKLKYVANDAPTWAALLLFARQPLRHHIHIGRFKTPVTIIDDRQITDTLFEAVEQAMKFVVSHIGVAFEFDGSLQRKERFFYPLPALREALLNAVVHRDYASSSDIQIKIFDDRITLFNPGKLYGGLTIEELQTDHYPSHLRNKLLAEAFYLTKNIEKYGSGLIRIRKELEAYPEVRFRLEEIGGGVLATFSRMREYDDGIDAGRVSEGVNEGVNEGPDLLFACIMQYPGLRIPDYSKHLNIPGKTLERWIKQLRDEKRVVFKGSPKKGGYFVL